MPKKRVLIVGGATCATRIRRLNEDCEIVIFEMGSYVSFANCGLPYFIGDVIVEEDKLLVATPALFENRFNIRICTDTQVLEINREQKRISVCDLQTEQQRFEHNDALVLSTGSQSIWPEIVGLDLPGVHVLRTIPSISYRGVHCTTVCGLFGLTVATTGVTEKVLETCSGIEYQKVYLHPSNHVGYYPGANLFILNCSMIHVMAKSLVRKRLESLEWQEGLMLFLHLFKWEVRCMI